MAADDASISCDKLHLLLTQPWTNYPIAKTVAVGHAQCTSLSSHHVRFILLFFHCTLLRDAS